MSENIAFYLLVTGIALLAVGYLAVVISAFHYRKWWGFIVMIPPLAPFTGLVYLLRHARRAVGAILLLLAGALFVAAPYGLNALSPFLIDLGPREKLVDGKVHLTLTGWDRSASEYPFVIRSRPRATVLQMANADVTDSVAEFLPGMTDLEELDLDNTQITDAALPFIAQLPKLHRLRLQGTRITDEGFQKHLMPMTQLKELNLRETAVSRETVQTWRAAQTGRRALR